MKLASFILVLIASLGGVFTLNARYATVTPPLDVTRQITAQQKPDDVLVSETALYQRGWIRARLEEPSLGGGCPDLLLLGSSTIGTFASEMFPGKRLLNAWAGNASVQDMESYSEIIARSPCRPRAILLGVDLWWTGNPAWSFGGWQDLASDYAGYHARHGGFAAHIGVLARWDAFKENLSFQRTRETLQTGRQRGFLHDVRARAGIRLVRGTPEEVCRTVSPREQYLRSFDGHYTSCTPESEEAIEKLARQYVASNRHSIADWHEIAANRLSRLEAVVSEWVTSGIRIVMVGMPYQPLAWEVISTDKAVGHNVRELDERLGALAKRAGATFLSFRDPRTVPCGRGDFHDSHHPRTSCTRRIAENVLETIERSQAFAP